MYLIRERNFRTINRLSDRTSRDLRGYFFQLRQSLPPKMQNNWCKDQMTIRFEARVDWAYVKKHKLLFP